jgi:hypothetical protein
LGGPFRGRSKAAKAGRLSPKALPLNENSLLRRPAFAKFGRFAIASIFARGFGAKNSALAARHF